MYVLRIIGILRRFVRMCQDLGWFGFIDDDLPKDVQRGRVVGVSCYDRVPKGQPGEPSEPYSPELRAFVD